MGETRHLGFRFQKTTKAALYLLWLGIPIHLGAKRILKWKVSDPVAENLSNIPHTHHLYKQACLAHSERKMSVYLMVCALNPRESPGTLA